MPKEPAARAMVTPLDKESPLAPLVSLPLVKVKVPERVCVPELMVAPAALFKVRFVKEPVPEMD